MDREQQLKDAYLVAQILLNREQSALAWSVAQLAIEAAGKYYSFGGLQHYTKQMDALFQVEK